MGKKGGDVKGVFARLARGIAAVGESVKAECGKDFALSEQYGYIHSCPTNLGTAMRDSLPSRRGARSWLSSLVEPVESPVASTAAPTTSPRSTDSKYNLTLIPSLTLWVFSMFWTSLSPSLWAPIKSVPAALVLPPVLLRTIPSWNGVSWNIVTFVTSFNVWRIISTFSYI